MVEVNDRPFSETSLQVPMPVVSPFVGFALPFFAIALILLTEKGVSALRVRIKGIYGVLFFGGTIPKVVQLHKPC